MGRMRILFVDDEAPVLAGLRRMLRPMRDQWEMHFASSAAEALGHLDESQVDVIVSDMRMPEMDGAELLRIVRERFPGMVRIALSGHADVEMFLKGVGAIHHFLSKPCDPELLKSVIRRALGLRSLLGDERLPRLCARMDHLPSLPDLYRQVMQEVRREDGSLGRVGEIVEQDIAMSARVIQLVNSPFYGLRSKVTSARHAVSLLGINAIRTLTLSAGVFSDCAPDDRSGLDAVALWRHSLRVAVLAREIVRAEGAGEAEQDDAYMAGMLHDIGKLILANGLAEEYAQVMVKSHGDMHDTQRAETEVFGCAHGMVGGYVLGLWGLPDPIVEALVHHHEPLQAPAREFSTLTAVHVANALDEEAGEGGSRGRAGTVDREYLEQLGLAHRLDHWAGLRERCLAAVGGP